MGSFHHLQDWEVPERDPAVREVDIVAVEGGDGAGAVVPGQPGPLRAAAGEGARLRLQDAPRPPRPRQGPHRAPQVRIDLAFNLTSCVYEINFEGDLCIHVGLVLNAVKE